MGDSPACARARRIVSENQYMTQYSTIPLQHNPWVQQQIWQGSLMHECQALIRREQPPVKRLKNITDTKLLQEEGMRTREEREKLHQQNLRQTIHYYFHSSTSKHRPSTSKTRNIWSNPFTTAYYKRTGQNPFPILGSSSGRGTLRNLHLSASRGIDGKQLN